MVIIYNATVGSVYNVQVQARNILGLGAIAQDTISQPMTIIINVCMQLGIHFTSTTKPPFPTTMTSEITSYSNNIIYPSQTCTCMTTTIFPSQICTTYYTNLASTGPTKEG